MNELLEFREKPTAEEIYMIAGWRQWADGGSISSALPQYLIDQTNAKKIGRIKSDSFYLFQLPFTQHFLRPEIRLEDGFPQKVTHRKNEFYYTTLNNKGLVIFLGDEPHLTVERYAEVLFDAVKELNVKRVIAFGGVNAPVPYNKDRQVSCTYSLKYMKEEMEGYAVRFSSYRGGVSIGSYLAERAGHFGVEYLGFHGFVPWYDLSQLSPRLQTIGIENDYKAWHDIMQRVNHMLALRFDLSDLLQQSNKLITSMDEQIDELEKKMPQVPVREYIEKLAEDFNEMSFVPLDDVWERELGDIFKDME